MHCKINQGIIRFTGRPTLDNLMTLSAKKIEHISKLACLGIDDEDSSLTKDVAAIMDFVDQLRAVDTTKVTPLFHPLHLQQPLRPDRIIEENCLAQLEELAPLFDDGLYLVPKVIDQGK